MRLVLFIFVFIIFIIGVEVLFALYGKKIEIHNPPPDPLTFGGSPKEISYLILGDSTAAGVGTDYEKGIAVSTAKELAKMQKVTLTNLAVSGARVDDVLHKQLPLAKSKPDIALIIVGSNDVTHLTPVAKIQKDTTTLIDQLIQKNCDIKIIITGSAAVNAAPRFLPPLSWLIKYRVGQLNTVFQTITQSKNLTFSPIAEKTGPIFQKDRTLFSPDKFHPNERGYVVWAEVLNVSIAEAVNHQRSHCEK